MQIISASMELPVYKMASLHITVYAWRDSLGNSANLVSIIHRISNLDLLKMNLDVLVDVLCLSG